MPYPWFSPVNRAMMFSIRSIIVFETSARRCERQRSISTNTKSIEFVLWAFDRREELALIDLSVATVQRSEWLFRCEEFASRADRLAFQCEFDGSKDETWRYDRLHRLWSKFRVEWTEVLYTVMVSQDGTSNSAMQRGYLREEILASPSTLTVDINYYLHQQILPVVSRLLEPFDGTDQALIAQCLGLDSSKYKQRQGKSYASKDDLNHDDANNHLDDEEFENEYLFSEGSEALKQCDPFVFPCVQCETLNFWNAPFVFNEVSERRETNDDGPFLRFNQDKTCFSPFLRCTNTACTSQPIDHLIYLRNRLSMMVTKAVRRYYQVDSLVLRSVRTTLAKFRTGFDVKTILAVHFEHDKPRWLSFRRNTLVHPVAKVNSLLK